VEIRDVTVVITNYNYEPYVSHAIDSVMMQEGGTPNLIVVDDKSTDSSLFVIKNKKNYWNKRLKDFEIVVNAENKGVVATRNNLLDRLEGKWVIFLDSDDALSENYVREVVATADKMQADVVYTAFMRMDKDNNLIEYDIHIPPTYNPLRMRAKNYMHLSALHRATDIRFRDMPALEDWVYWLEKQKRGDVFVRCETTGLYYRRHGESRNTISGDKMIVTRQKIKEYLGNYCLGV